MEVQDRRIIAAMFQLLMRAMWCIILPEESYLQETLRADYSTFSHERLRDWVGAEEEVSG